MSIDRDPLYLRVAETKHRFQDEAAKHRRLNRRLWWASALLSVAIAFTANFPFIVEIPLVVRSLSGFDSVSSSSISAALALVLPMVTAYVLLRTPEKLWILETHARNRLRDLLVRMELAAERQDGFDRARFEKEYFEIMAQANERWAEAKQGSG